MSRGALILLVTLITTQVNASELVHNLKILVSQVWELVATI